MFALLIELAVKPECFLLFRVAVGVFAHIIIINLSDLKREGRPCFASIREEQHPPWIHSRKCFGEDQTSSSDQTFLGASEKWKGKSISIATRGP